MLKSHKNATVFSLLSFKQQKCVEHCIKAHKWAKPCNTLNAHKYVKEPDNECLRARQMQLSARANEQRKKSKKQQPPQQHLTTSI